MFPSPQTDPTRTATLSTEDGVPISACYDAPLGAEPVALAGRAETMALAGRAETMALAGRAETLCFVVAHGFTGSWRRPAVRRVAAVLASLGGVVGFDFRGHGTSGGWSTVGDREVLDLRAAVAWARELGHGSIVTIGFSMGAAVAVRHAGLYGGLAATAAVSGPSRWYYRGTPPMRRAHWVIERRLGRLVGRVALGTRIAAGGWDPLPEAPYEIVGRISPVPLLIVHGDADAYFPVEHAEKLYAAAAEPKELWIEPGFGHAENAAPDELVHRIGTWLGQRARS